MLSKIQKTWLWIFGAMFVVPEVLFSPIISFASYLAKISFSSLYSLGIKNNFLPDDSTYLFIAVIIELVGVLGLLIFSVKLKNKLSAIFLGLAFIFLCFMLFFLYSISSMGF